MGCGASKTAPAPEDLDVGFGAKKPVKRYSETEEIKAQTYSAQSGGRFDSRKSSNSNITVSKSKRRKTQTLRRAAVSTETSDQRLGSFEELRMVPKSEDVTTKLMGALRAHPLFEHLAVALLSRCIEAMVEHTHANSDTVITQGDAGDHFYLVYSGSYEAFMPPGAASKSPAARRTSSDGVDELVVNEKGETILQVFGVGDGFGELALLYNSPRACSVRATSADAAVYALDRAAFRQLVMHHNSGLKVGLEKYLRSVPLLSSLEDDEAFASLADCMTAVDYADGEYIVEIGHAADTLFLVLSGEVVCHRKGGDDELLRLQVTPRTGAPPHAGTPPGPHHRSDLHAVRPRHPVTTPVPRPSTARRRVSSSARVASARRRATGNASPTWWPSAMCAWAA